MITTCRELADFLMQYIEDELPAGQRTEFERHLAACPPCLAYLETYKTTIGLGKALCESPTDPLPNDVPERLVQAILAARAKTA